MQASRAGVKLCPCPGRGWHKCDGAHVPGGEGLVGGDRGHNRAHRPGGAAAGPASALPPSAEGQAEPHAHCGLLLYSHGQLAVRPTRYCTPPYAHSL